MNLSDNEIKFLKLICSELTYKEIAEKMFKSLRTVEDYRNNLFIKLEKRSRTGLVIWAIENGIFEVKAKATLFV
jgi:DNA-binding NarL/FixJ family response regulator